MVNVKYVLVTLVLVAVGIVVAFNEDEKKQILDEVLPHLLSCGAESGNTKEEIFEAKKRRTPDGLNGCFYGCLSKKYGVIDDKGLFDIEAARATYKKFLHSEEESKNIEEALDECKSVNDANVSDGEKGCERAQLLVNCYFTHKASVIPF